MNFYVNEYEQNLTKILMISNSQMTTLYGKIEKSLAHKKPLIKIRGFCFFWKNN